MIDNQHATTRYTSDELDVRDIVSALWVDRLLVAVVTGLVTIATVVFVFVANPDFSVRSIVRPATLDQLDVINRTNLIRMTQDAALQRVGAALESYENRRAYFFANGQLFKTLHLGNQSPEQVFEAFNEEAFVTLQPDPKKTDNLSSYVGLSLTYPRGIDGVKILNGFVDYARRAERDKLIGELRALIENRIRTIEWEIQSARVGYGVDKSAKIAAMMESDTLKKAQLQDELAALRRQLKHRRLDRIALLEESIGIANQLGIVKPTTPSAHGKLERSELGGDMIVRTEINNQAFPLYFMGSEALTAERDALSARVSDDFAEPRIAEIEKELRLLANNREIEVLRNRENEDLFLAKLAAWEQEIAQLNAIEIDPEQIRLVNLDQPATSPRHAIWPKKRIFVMVGVLAGLVLGISAALLRRFIGDAIVAREA